MDCVSFVSALTSTLVAHIVVKWGLLAWISEPCYATPGFPEMSGFGEIAEFQRDRIFGADAAQVCQSEARLGAPCRRLQSQTRSKNPFRRGSRRERRILWFWNFRKFTLRAWSGSLETSDARGPVAPSSAISQVRLRAVPNGPLPNSKQGDPTSQRSPFFGRPRGPHSPQGRAQMRTRSCLRGVDRAGLHPRTASHPLMPLLGGKWI